MTRRYRPPRRPPFPKPARKMHGVVTAVGRDLIAGPSDAGARLRPAVHDGPSARRIAQLVSRGDFDVRRFEREVVERLWTVDLGASRMRGRSAVSADRDR